jgi:hypothetical protein
MPASTPQLTYLKAKDQVITALLRCISEHEAGRLLALDTSIDETFDRFDGMLPRDAGPEFDKICVAFEFWAGWMDSSIHDWKYYDGIRASDWPRLARLIIADLEADREISDPLVLARFGLKEEVNRPPMLERVKRLFTR